jgi:hypothetical protein
MHILQVKDKVFPGPIPLKAESICGLKTSYILVKSVLKALKRQKGSGQRIYPPTI